MSFTLKSQRPQMDMLSYLELRHCYYTPMGFSQPIGLFSACLCLILRGRLTVHCAQGVIRAKEGDVVYWPAGVPYESNWESDGLVEFIGAYHRMDAVHPQRGVTVDQRRSEPCERFVVFENLDCEGLMRRMDRAWHQRGGDCEAITLFYRLYERVRASLPEGRQMRPTVRQAQAYMETHWNQPFRMAELAACCGLSESRLYHVFKEETGKSPVDFKNEVRIRRAASLLLREDVSVEWVSEYMHFSSVAYFRRVFRRYMGMTPSAYRQKVGMAL